MLCYEERRIKPRILWNLIYSLFFMHDFHERRIMLENKFKTKLIKELEELFPGCMIFHLDPLERQGSPDLLILYENKWAALEGKKSATASHRVNQDYYVDLMNDMSYASFIYPENKEEIIHELQQALQPRRTTRIPRRK